MIFVFTQMIFEDSSEKMDNLLDFLTGKSGGKRLGKLGSAGKLEKAGEGRAVKLKIQAKAHLMWVNLHDSGREG